MKRAELTSIVRGIAPVVRKFVTDSLVSVTGRVDALERLAREAPGATRDLWKGLEETVIDLRGRLSQLEERAPVEAVKGQDGTAFRVGHGAPTFTAKAGDGYLDATTGDVYEWR